MGSILRKRVFPLFVNLKEGGGNTNVESRKAIDRYNVYRFFQFFLDLEAMDLGCVFCDTGLLPDGLLGGCKVSILHICCIAATLLVNWLYIFLVDLLNNLAMTNYI